MEEFTGKDSNVEMRTIIEQNLQQKSGKPNETVTSIGKMMRPVDEDFEPVRPTMENNNITPQQFFNAMHSNRI